MNDYQTKFVTPEQAVKAVQSGDWVDYGFGLSRTARPRARCA